MFEIKENEKVVVKKFLKPESSYNNSYVAYTISSDDCVKDGVKQSTDIDACFSIGEGNNTFRISFWMDSKKDVEDALEDIDAAINALSDFRLEVLKVNSKHPAENINEESEE